MHVVLVIDLTYKKNLPSGTYILQDNSLTYVTLEAFMAIHVQSPWNKINTHLLNVQLCITWYRSSSGCCCAVVWISLPNKHAATAGAWIHLANLQEQKTISFEQHLLSNNYFTVACPNWRSASLLIIQSSVAFFLSLIWKVWSTCVWQEASLRVQRRKAFQVHYEPMRIAPYS